VVAIPLEPTALDGLEAGGELELHAGSDNGVVVAAVVGC
jgi:hypothetical protein